MIIDTEYHDGEMHAICLGWCELYSISDQSTCTAKPFAAKITSVDNTLDDCAAGDTIVTCVDTTMEAPDGTISFTCGCAAGKVFVQNTAETNAKCVGE